MPLVGREFVQRRALVQRGIVDDDVQRTEVALDRGDAGGNRIGVGDIEWRDLGAAGPAAVAVERSGGRLELGAIAAVDDDARAGGGEPACDREPEPAAAAGDERQPPGQVERMRRGHRRRQSRPRTSRMSYRPGAFAARRAATKRAARSAPCANVVRDDALCASSMRSPGPANITV